MRPNIVKNSPSLIFQENCNVLPCCTSRRAVEWQFPCTSLLSFLNNLRSILFLRVCLSVVLLQALYLTVPIQWIAINEIQICHSFKIKRFPDSISTRTLFRHLINGEITELIPPDSISTRTLGDHLSPMIST